MRAASILFLILSCSSSCSSSGGRPEPFVAFGSDFADFRTWPSWKPEWAFPGNDHLSGPRVVYSSLPSQSGEVKAAFPVGTIIVKESGDGDLGSRHLFGMVKRGGGFNQTGAKGWEWFELSNIDDKQVRIVWRGVGPTNGDAYGGDATGGCNLCHASAASTDFVFSASELGLRP